MLVAVVVVVLGSKGTDFRNCCRDDSSSVFSMAGDFDLLGHSQLGSRILYIKVEEHNTPSKNDSNDCRLALLGDVDVVVDDEDEQVGLWTPPFCQGFLDIDTMVGIAVLLLQ